MRTLKSLTFILLLFIAFSCSNCSKDEQKTSPDSYKPKSPPSGETVYICTGPYSKKYHADSDCKGLSKCGKEIIAIDKSKAESMGRTPCSICF